MDGFSSCRGNCLCCLFHLPSPEGQEICVFHLLGIDLLLSAEEVFPCGLRSFRGDQIAVSELETDAIRSLNAWMGVEGERSSRGFLGVLGRLGMGSPFPAPVPPRACAFPPGLHYTSCGSSLGLLVPQGWKQEVEFKLNKCGGHKGPKAL